MYLLINAVLNFLLIKEKQKNIKGTPPPFRKKYEAAQQFPTLIINQYIRMISEGSCDTEDLSNDAENWALISVIHYILKYIKIENTFFIAIFHYIYVYICMYV